jgi:4'-phosphopantetheinyl transferase
MFVDVWLTRREAAVSAALESSLSPGERTRAARFVRAVDASNYVHAHSALRCVLATYLKCAPAAIVFRHRPCHVCGERHGKPELAEPTRPKISFSFARSARFAAIAVGTSEVGVDIEAVPRSVDLVSLAGSLMSHCERAQLRALPTTERSHALLLNWTVKEAFLKGLGVGLAEQLGGVSVHVEGDMRWRVTAPSAPIWHAVSLWASPGVPLTVAAPAPLLERKTPNEAVALPLACAARVRSFALDPA